MGYTRKDRIMNGMFSKSSRQFADRVEKKILKLAFGVGKSLLSTPKTSSSKVTRTHRSQFSQSSTMKTSRKSVLSGKLCSSQFINYDSTCHSIIAFLDDRYVVSIGQEGPWGRTWYYIRSKDNPSFECVVDCIRMMGYGEEYLGKLLFSTISSGKEVGVKIDGYAIFIHPSQESKRKSEKTIDGTFLPQIQDMADSFLMNKILLEPDKFDIFKSSDIVFA